MSKISSTMSREIENLSKMSFNGLVYFKIFVSTFCPTTPSLHIKIAVRMLSQPFTVTAESFKQSYLNRYIAVSPSLAKIYLLPGELCRM